jgi:hypothetical protein
MGRSLDYELAAVNLSERGSLDVEARLINLLSVELDNIAIPSWPRGEVERWHYPQALLSSADLGHGAMLRAFRKRHGLSQTALATELGLRDPRVGGRSLLAKWEGGAPCSYPLRLLERALADLERELTASR